MNTTTVDLSMQACVTRGAAWLDEIAPDWRSRINRETLNLNTYCDCVAGQVFGITEGGPYARASTVGQFHYVLSLLDTSEHMTPACADAIDTLAAQIVDGIEPHLIYPEDLRYYRMAATAGVFGFNIVRTADDADATLAEEGAAMVALRGEWVTRLDEVLPG